MVIVHLSHDTSLDGPRNVLDVHEVAVGTTVAASLVERSAARLSEVGDRGVLGLNQLAAVKAASQLHQRTLRILFVVVLDVDVAYHVVAKVVHNHQILDLAVVCQLKKHLDVKGLQVLLSSVVHVIVPWFVICQCKRLRGVGIHVRQKQSLTHSRPVVKAIALIAISAGSNLEVEWAIDSVLLCPKDPRKLLGHLAKKESDHHVRRSATFSP
mmetsp:Transcript_10044/g.16023  ORF Transcript_10044/g.16023 Transcript_10044/m.16023 type:complete len:212 (-) Transcript_10044:21-656(-)